MTCAADANLDRVFDDFWPGVGQGINKIKSMRRPIIELDRPPADPGDEIGPIGPRMGEVTHPCRAAVLHKNIARAVGISAPGWPAAARKTKTQTSGR
jgi:hypothetical protein